MIKSGCLDSWGTSCCLTWQTSLLLSLSASLDLPHCHPEKPGAPTGICIGSEEIGYWVCRCTGPAEIPPAPSLHFLLYPTSNPSANPIIPSFKIYPESDSASLTKTGSNTIISHTSSFCFLPHLFCFHSCPPSAHSQHRRDPLNT